jgi:chromosome segregation ATPase
LSQRKPVSCSDYAPQRLKGAIDNRIAEEQARQRQQALSASPQRPTQRRRPLDQNDPGSRTSSRQRQPGNAPSEKGPDPSEFEPEFAIGDDESAAPSRTSTPKPPSEQTTVTQEAAALKEGDSIPKGGETAESRLAETNELPIPQVRTQELPNDVQVKLKKLDRLEAKYGELLKAYRIAHARVQIIEPFEASLREYTPLTSISDPSALVEYLGQVTAKGDMVLDEFKRVSAERDDFKKRAELSEDTASQLRAELAESKKMAAERPDLQAPEGQATTSDAESDQKLAQPVKEPTSPTASVKSPALTSSRIPSFSLFSPRTKPTSPPPKEAEDLFSYDSEVPRLESELQEQQQQVAELKNQMEKLKGDLVVARESTEGMVVSLETATRELHELREAKDKFDGVRSSLEMRIRELQIAAQANTDGEKQATDEIEKLREEKSSLSQQIEKLQKQVDELEQNNSSLHAKVQSNQRETNILNEKLGQKDHIVKDLEDTLAMMKSADRQTEKIRSQEESSEKKLGTMQGIMDNLRSQLTSAEATVRELRDEIRLSQESFEARPSSRIFAFLDEGATANLPELRTRDEAVDYLASNFGLQKDRHITTSTTTPTTTVASTSATTPATSVAPSEAGTNLSSKKRNKKKKKGKAGQTMVEEGEPEDPVKVSEDQNDVNETDKTLAATSSSSIVDLEATIVSLKSEVSSKDANIDRLLKQIKDEEALREEIETLRDDLLHQGEEHVEARDKLKTAVTERDGLTTKVEQLEKELLDTKRNLAAGIASSETHEKTLQEVGDLRSQLNILQIDLKAAEQLAQTRFKDLTDLKNVLAKAQPELKSLRTENAELKTAKEDLKNKVGDLNRLEARHEDLKSEIKGLAKRLSDKDGEIKDLQSKVEQESKRRVSMEEELEVKMSELRAAEKKRDETVNTEREVREELKRVRQEGSALRERVEELEDQISGHRRETGELREEVGLKTALHSSAQSLVQSLRDQTHELTIQAREATTRSENLEEELAEAQRMLSERTREGETMRMLLSQSETGTEARVREMKERMDRAIEERDRIEDEASVSNRRSMREVDDARRKLRDAERALKVTENEKEELDIRLRDCRRKLEDTGKEMEKREKEAEDANRAMIGLREALDESERQVREMEGQKGDLRRGGDEARERIEKLSKANRNLTEEVKALQATVKPQRPGITSGLASSRTSLDSSRTRSPAPPAQTQSQSQRPNSRSETPTGTGAGAGLSQGTVDYVYLKNVLLQFLEQKDRAHQRQLIPVIGMLLHFDRKDEQRWVSAITSR